ncbi:MAG: hypothetical protein FWG87_09350 [Defluviitaleaceae bacterium]|nr:hypothetical protein [Defluviitaleaceae bacterium]
MKKLLFLTLVVMALAFTACGGTESDNDTNITSNDTPVAETPATETPSTETPIEEAPIVETVVRERAERPEGVLAVVYSLETDEELQELPVGTSGGSEDVFVSPYLVGSGNPTFRIVENPLGGNAIRLTHREQSWYAVDIITPELELNTADYSYVLLVSGNIARAGSITVTGGDSPHATFFTQEASAGDFVLTGIINERVLENAGERGHLRVGANNAADLEIHELEILRIERIAPVVIPERPENVLWSLATDEHLQNRSLGDSGAGGAILGGTSYLQDAGNPHFTIVENPNGTGFALRVSNRTQDWHTIDIMTNNMDGFNPAEHTYTIRFSGKVEEPPADSTADIMGTDSPYGRFAAVDVSGDGEFTVVADNINAETMAENGATNRIRIAPSGEAGASVYYIYELEVIRN